MGLMKNIFIITLLFALSPFASATESNLDVKHLVLGVIVSNVPQKSLALIKNQSSKSVSAYKIGDKLNDKTIIKKIARKHIEISVNNKPYMLAVGAQSAVSIEEFDPSTQVSYKTNEIERNGDTIRLTSNFKDHIVKEKLGEVLMQAATEVVVKDGMVIGFKIFDITPDSIYEKAGFQNGDVITHINGLEMNDAGVAIRTLNQIKNSNEAEIRFLRGGSTQQLKININ
jgi:type II secretion system protein C